MLLFLLFACNGVTSQSPGVTIEVQYLLGYPIPNASIYLDGAYVGTTNDNGTFVLTGYSPGTHNVTAVHSNYENCTKDVDLYQVSDVLLRMQDKWVVVPSDVMVIYAREHTDAQSLITGASVYIDESLVGETDHNGKVWTTNYTGIHTVRISKKGSVDEISTINFVQGGNETLYLDRVEKKYSIFDSELFIYALSKELALGIVATVKLSVIAFTVGIIIGLIMGLGRVSKNRFATI
jgi:polar amino acid transport system permease protein